MQRHANNLILYLIAVIVASLLSACSEDNVYNSLPEPISKFVAQYYPGTDVSSFTNNNGVYTVKVSNGPTITFNKDYSWTSLDTNGNTISDVFLYDQLPPALYEYLQSTQATHSVYSVSRDSRQYELKLFDYSLTYDISTAQITGSSAL